MQPTFKTKDEFIQQEYEKLKDHMGQYDIQLSKVGLVGYLTNLLGTIQFDANNYYTNLYKNSFIPTTVDTHNLYLHCSTFGYSPNKCKPSTASGLIVFDFDLMPRADIGVLKKEVILKNISFMIDGMTFVTKNTYVFIQEKTSYYGIIIDEFGKSEYISSPSSLIELPFKNVLQYEVKEQIIQIPGYDDGTFHLINIDLGSNFLFELDINVRKKNKQYETPDTWDKFKVETIVYNNTSKLDVCFLKERGPHSYSLELGSGINGIHIPNSQLKLTQKITRGKLGNLLVTHDVILNTMSNITVYYTDLNKKKLIDIRINQLFSVKFKSSYGGMNPESDKEVKQKLTNFIQSRDMLLTKDDFYNIENENGSDFVYSFRKSMIQQNIFFLYKLFISEYQTPIKSLCTNIKKLNPTEVVNNIKILPHNIEHGKLNSSRTYIYRIYACDGFFYTDVGGYSEVIMSNDFNANSITWNKFDCAQFYIIQVTSNVNEIKYYKTYENKFIDYGESTHMLSFDKSSYLFFPECIINSTKFISPFIYKYNKYMDYFDGYIFYDSVDVNFAEIKNNINDDELPICRCEVKYNYIKSKTELYIRSYQDISRYTFNLSISNNIVQNALMTNIDENTFKVDYNKQKNILFGEHIFEVKMASIIGNTKVVLVSETFFQLKKINDLLYLPMYTTDDDQEYILNLPVIEYKHYIQNKPLINRKILDEFYNRDIKNKRFISDNIQIRFLNNYYINHHILSKYTIQQYDFDLVLPLNINIKINMENQYLTNNFINLSKEQNDLHLDIAQKLNDSYTGIEIKYYNSQLIEFIHYQREFIKSVKILVTDSNNNIIDNGLELLSEQDTIDNLQEDNVVNLSDKKLNILNFFPIYVWWDLENINIEYNF